MKPNKIQIAIAEDKQEDIIIIKKAFEDLPQYEIIITAIDGRDLVEKLEVANQLPQLILMDIQMPCCDGLLTTIICKEQYPNVKIVGLSSHTSPEVISEFIAEGGNGFLSKFIVQKNSGIYKIQYNDPDFFAKALNQILTSDELYFDPLIQYIQEDYTKKITTKKIIAKNFPHLKPMDIYFLQLNAGGFSQKQMKFLLKREISTIKKMGIKHRNFFMAETHQDLSNICQNVGIVKLARLYQTY